MMLAILLSLGVYLLWFGSFGTQVEDPALATEELASVEGSEAPVETQDPDTQPIGTQTDENIPAPALEPTGFTPTIVTSEQSVPLEGQALGIIDGTASDMGRWRSEVHSNNGTLRNIILDDYSTAPDYHSIWGHGINAVTGAPNPEDGWSPYSGLLDYHTVISEDGALVLAGCCGLGNDGAGDLEDDGAYQVEEVDGTIIATSQTANGLQITKTYSQGSDPYTVDVQVIFENLSDKTLEGLWVGVADQMSGDAGRFMSAVRPNAYVDESIENVYDMDDVEGDEVEIFTGPVDWFGIGDRYFMGVLIPECPAENTSQDCEGVHAGSLVVDTLPGGRTGSFLVYDESLAPNSSRNYGFTAYVGPKSLDILDPMGPELEQAVEFGWFGVFSKPLLWLLKGLHGLVNNWGVAIIMLTFLIKLLFFRLTQKTYESSSRMQILQPQLKELKEKFKDNKELQTQETMKLFKENKVNPMGACLPMLLQLPVWFALYNTMLYSVELYNASFLIFEDLTAPDPFGILPTLYVLLMVAQQRMMPMASMDPTQRKVMKMMPLIFGFFMYTFPSGLVLYFCVNMLLTILQQWIIKKNLKELPAAKTAS